MAIRMFISDLDDSLLRDDQTIGERTVRALKALEARGVTIALASGRMYSAMRRYVEQLGVTAPAITLNGAMIVDTLTGRPLSRMFIEPDLAREALQECERMGLYVQSYDEQGYFFERECEFSRYYERVSGVKGGVLGRPASECVSGPMPKIVTINTPERTRELLPVLKERFAGRLEVAISKPMYIEMTHPRANKGDALRSLCERMGVAPCEVMACGDGLNDLGMIGLAGLGVVVANAREAVRAQADVVCPANEEEGIAQLIERMAGLERGEACD